MSFLPLLRRGPGALATASLLSALAILLLIACSSAPPDTPVPTPTTEAPAETPAPPPATRDWNVFGSTDAPVTVLDYSDFQ